VRKLVYALVPVVFSSCGGNSAGQVIGTGGGQLCLPDNSVCITIPLNALNGDTPIFIRPSDDKPGAPLSATWQIGPDGTLFAVNAQVAFAFSDSLDSGLPEDLDTNQLRIYTRALLDGGAYGDWVPLDMPVVDRVTNHVTGTTSHLSPFVLLRADRLPDGGLPVEGDAGPMKDAGMVTCPPPCNPMYSCTDGMQNGNETGTDCGGPDCAKCPNGMGCTSANDCESGRCAMMICKSKPDAGMPDSGVPDSGVPDSGVPDSGVPDAGHPDSGVPDSGVPDSGVPDAGVPDSGVPDAGVPDAGTPDAGVPDAGMDMDAGTDAGCDDAGDGGCL
jgi:hypothetical protein